MATITTSSENNYCLTIITIDMFNVQELSLNHSLNHVYLADVQN